jgi:hypothetical protein
MQCRSLEDAKRARRLWRLTGASGCRRKRRTCPSKAATLRNVIAATGIMPIDDRATAERPTGWSPRRRRTVNVERVKLTGAIRSLNRAALSLPYAGAVLLSQ